MQNIVPATALDNLFGLMTLGTSNNLQPKWRKDWGGRNSFPRPSEIVLLIALAFVSFLDLVLQFFSMQNKVRPPTCIFFCLTLGISNFWYSGHSFSAIFTSGYNVFLHSTWMIKVRKKITYRNHLYPDSSSSLK